MTLDRIKSDDTRNSFAMHMGVVRLAYASAATVFLFLLGLSVLFPTKSTELRVVLETPESGSLQAYYDFGDGLSERVSSRSAFRPGLNRLTLSIPPGALRAIRLDPSSGTGEIRLLEVTVNSAVAGRLIEISPSQITAVNEAKKVESEGSGVLFDLEDAGKDPQLFVSLERAVEITADEEPYLRTKNLMIAAAVLLLLFALSFSRPSSAIAPWLFLPLPLIMAMATLTTTAQSVHPDELNHAAAARYYFSNWVPRGAEDPRMLETYTSYGTSYLNELDVVYFFAGKASRIWSHLAVDDIVALRWFNVLLFFLLLLFAWNRRRAWPGAMFLLMTPQIWYLFSYFNADAFPLFLAFLLVFLYAAPDSGVSRFIDEGRSAGRAKLAIAVAFAVVLGLLLVSKRNYLPVVFVSGLFLSIRHLRLPIWSVLAATTGAAFFVFRYAANLNLEGLPPLAIKFLVPIGIVLFLLSGFGLARPVFGDVSLRPKFVRLVALFVIACAVAFPRVAIDRYVNGDSENKHRALQAMAEIHAIPGLKPSAISKGIGLSMPGHNLAEKGVGYFEIFSDDRDWIGRSWKSMIGVYGNMGIWAAPVVYLLISFGLALCAIRLVWQARYDPQIRPYIALACCGAVLTVLSSTVYSWVVDFQAQGRYLLPALVMFASVFIAVPGLMRSRLILISMTSCLLGSVCSFVFFAMPSLLFK